MDQLVIGDSQKLQISDLEVAFRHRYEQYLGRVHHFVGSRVPRDREVEPLVERILLETLDDWMGPGEDAARAARVLARARGVIAESPGVPPAAGVRTA